MWHVGNKEGMIQEKIMGEKKKGDDAEIKKKLTGNQTIL